MTGVQTCALPISRDHGYALNPCDGVRAPKSPKRLPHALSPDQAARLLEFDAESALQACDQAMFELFYSSGLRLSELVGLCCGDIAMGDATVRVTGKGAKTRVVPVGSKALDAIRRWLELRAGMVEPGQDALFVTGELGGSRAGHHLDFEPRLVEARWLAEHFPIHAMMDLSDGIAGDLPHILAASGGPGAELLASAIPIRREARIAARSGSLAKPAMLAALTDGEDFELLMAVPSTHAVALLDAWKSTFPTTRVTCIGKVTREPGLRLREKDGVRRLSAHGYDHFQGPR